VNSDCRGVDEGDRQDLAVHFWLAGNVKDRRSLARGGGGSGEEENCELLYIDCTAGQKAILGRLFGGLCVLHVIFSKQGDAYDAFCSQSFGMADLEMIEKTEDFCSREEIEMECDLQSCFERLRLNGCGVSVERRFT
jgi:hypothetical protein